MCIYSEDPERGSIIHFADSVEGGGGLRIHLADQEEGLCIHLADPKGDCAFIWRIHKEYCAIVWRIKREGGVEN